VPQGVVQQVGDQPVGEPGIAGGRRGRRGVMSKGRLTACVPDAIRNADQQACGASPDN
jgi:hypothetical protein